MQVTAEKMNQHEVQLTITVDAAEVDRKIKAAVKRIASQVNIPGFRKGKAPRKVLESNYGKEAILGEAFEMIAQEQYLAALKEGGYEPVSAPAIETVTFAEGSDCVFKAVFTNKPEVTLGAYKGLDVAKEAVTVTEEMVQQQLENIRNQFAEMVVAPDGATLEEGDLAIIDFEGFIDGVPFDGGKGQSYPLTIGSGNFIPGFEEQMVGAKKGEDVVVRVSFPEDYHVEALAGKASEFKVHIHDIKRKELPALDDTLAKNVSSYETFAELEADLRKKMQADLERQAEEAYVQALVKTAVANATVDVPAVMVDEKVEEMLQESDMQLQMQGRSLSDYLQFTGRTVEDLKADARPRAEEEVRKDLVLEAIARAENIEVTMDDMNLEVFMMAQNFGADPKEVFEIIVKENRIGMLRRSVGLKKAVRFLVQEAAGAAAEAVAEETVSE